MALQFSLMRLMTFQASCALIVIMAARIAVRSVSWPIDAIGILGCFCAFAMGLWSRNRSNKRFSIRFHAVNMVLVGMTFYMWWSAYWTFPRFHQDRPFPFPDALVKHLESLMFWLDPNGYGTPIKQRSWANIPLECGAFLIVALIVFRAGRSVAPQGKGVIVNASGREIMEQILGEPMRVRYSTLVRLVKHVLCVLFIAACAFLVLDVLEMTLRYQTTHLEGGESWGHMVADVVLIQGRCGLATLGVLIGCIVMLIEIDGVMRSIALLIANTTFAFVASITMYPWGGTWCGIGLVAGMIGTCLPRIDERTIEAVKLKMASLALLGVALICSKELSESPTLMRRVNSIVCVQSFVAGLALGDLFFRSPRLNGAQPVSK